MQTLLDVVSLSQGVRSCALNEQPCTMGALSK